MEPIYIVIIVKNREDVKQSVEFENIKVEYVSIGTIFHGRQFKGTRPTHVIDQSKVSGWYEHLRKGVNNDVEWEVV